MGAERGGGLLRLNLVAFLPSPIFPVTCHWARVRGVCYSELPEML